MTKEDLVNAILTKRRMHRTKARSLVSLVFKSIVEEVANGPVCIVGFGCWILEPIERIGWNFQTNQQVKVSTNVVRFLLSEEFQDRLNEDFYFDTPP